MKTVKITLLALSFLIASTGQAHAYLDPGSGSYIIQFIIAGLVGSLFGIKTFWLQIKTFIGGFFSRNKGKENSVPKKKNGK